MYSTTLSSHEVLCRSRNEAGGHVHVTVYCSYTRMRLLCKHVYSPRHALTFLAPTG